MRPGTKLQQQIHQPHVLFDSLNIFGRMKTLVSVFLFIALIVSAGSCRKEQEFSRRQVDLRLSSDTIFLDTVFTNVGSSTRTLRVSNPTNEDLYIDRIYLAKGNASYYRLNVNGIPGKDLKDVELLANDSITILIEVTADVANAGELLYTDSIVFNTLGNIQDVDLVTLTKDAHFYYPTNALIIPQPPFPDIVIPYSVLDCNTVWAADKPHVIYGYAVVDSGCVLTVEPGAEIHFHSGSGLWVTGAGRLEMDPNDVGQMDVNPIVIQGDRLEPFYENVAGQWGGVLGGIFIQSGSTGNVIRNTIIKNGTIGIRTDSTNSLTPNLTLFNTQLLNHSRVGLYGGFGHIESENVVIGNSGLYGFYALGGRYKFTHCTFANYTSSGRGTPTIGLFNFFEGPGGTIYTRDIAAADFRNCIVYGARRVEFGIGYKTSADLNFTFRNSLLRIEENPEDESFDREDPTKFIDCILDNDPMFVNRQNFEYDLDSASPALNVGNTTFAQEVPLDILKVDRTSTPDLGAYERQD